MSCKRFNLAVLILLVLTLSACKLPVDTSVTTIAEEEVSEESLITEDTDESSLDITTDLDLVEKDGSVVVAQGDKISEVEEETLITDEPTVNNDFPGDSEVLVVTPDVNEQIGTPVHDNNYLVSNDTDVSLPETNNQVELSNDVALEIAEPIVVVTPGPAVDSNVDQINNGDIPQVDGEVQDPQTEGVNSEVVESDITLDTNSDLLALDTVTQEPEIKLDLNKAPVLVNKEFYTKEDVALTGLNLLANDIDPDGDALIITSYSQGNYGGKIEQDSNGTFYYTPFENFNGVEEFTYTVIDGKGGESFAKVLVYVESVNDFVVNDEEFYVNEDEVLRGINLLANDIDVDGGTLRILSYTHGFNGGIVEMLQDGSFVYTPAPDFHGKDEFTYVVTDGQGGKSIGVTTVWVESVNDIPVAVADSVVVKQSQSYEIMLLDNDKGLGDGAKLSLVTAPENGTGTISASGTMLYTPNENYSGSDSFVYKLIDENGDESLATVSIQVECDSGCNQTIALSWEPSLSHGVVGYKLYVGNSPNDYSEVLDLGDVTQFDYIAPDKGTYYFAISALNLNEIESALSEEISVTF